MAYSILLMVEKPDDVKERDKGAKYANFQFRLQGLIQRNKDIRVLSEGAILLPIDHGLQDLADLVQSISELFYTYIVLTDKTPLLSLEGKV